MRRKAKTELGTFSASAIDLFASALGAFIIITVVLFPYFPNLSPNPLKKIIEQLQDDKENLQNQVSNLSDQNMTLTDKNKNLQDQVQAQTATIQQQQGQIASANAQAAAAQQSASQAQAAAQAAVSASGNKDQQIADLQGQLDGTAFIGVEPETNNFQIVLDMSGSIKDYRETVQKVVRDILSRMDSNDNLRFITYQGEVASPSIESWPNGNNFKNGLTDSDKSAARGFVNSALENAGGYTPTFEAMKNVLAISESTTIILLTDGVPQVSSNDGGNGASRTSIAVAVENATLQNSGKHQINIVAIGEFGNSEQASAIVPLATQNSGVLVAMP